MYSLKFVHGPSNKEEILILKAKLKCNWTFLVCTYLFPKLFQILFRKQQIDLTPIFLSGFKKELEPIIRYIIAFGRRQKYHI